MDVVRKTERGTVREIGLRVILWRFLTSGKFVLWLNWKLAHQFWFFFDLLVVCELWVHTRQTDGRTGGRTGKTRIAAYCGIITNYSLELKAVDQYCFVAVISAHLWWCHSDVTDHCRWRGHVTSSRSSSGHLRSLTIAVDSRLRLRRNILTCLCKQCV